MGRIEDTYKAKDVEEIVDIWLYRPWGYMLAVAAHRFGLTPNQISLFGMAVGVTAGHFFFYDSLWLNLLGILLWAFGQALDGADGQLARMANMRSQLGRMLDGISDNVKFVSVYAHLGARLVAEFGSPWPIALVVLAALMHSYQSALADYYRNAYLFFVYGSAKAEIEDLDSLRAQYAGLSWGREPVMKFLVWGYIRYSVRQDLWSGRSEALRSYAVERCGPDMPDPVREAYRKINKPLLRYYNALTTNTRMIVLYGLLLWGQVIWFFAFELIVLNGVMLLLWTWWQRSADRRMVTVLDEWSRVSGEGTRRSSAASPAAAG